MRYTAGQPEYHRKAALPSREARSTWSTLPPVSVLLSDLIGAPILAAQGQRLGKLTDVIVRLPEQGCYPSMTGLVGRVSGRELYVNLDKVSVLTAGEVRLSSAKLDVRPFERRDGEILLRRDLLGHRLIDVSSARLVRAHNVFLEERAGVWLLTSVDTSARHRLFGRRSTGDNGVLEARDWSRFEPLIGHGASALTRGRVSRLTRLRPAQIADLVEEADKRETDEIMQAVHVDAELEADVFEEMDADRQVEVLKHRSDVEVAQLLVHMRADDAADLIADLPQDRRLNLLALLPAGVQAKIRALLGFNPATAGGLMTPDFLALPENTLVSAAIEQVGLALGIPHEVLATIYVVAGGELRGAINLAGLLQANGSAPLGDVVDKDPVRVHPDADVTEVAIRMTDFNMLTIPVVDDLNTLLGVITVDDVLEVTVPEDWRRREDGAATADNPPGAPTTAAPHLQTDQL